MDRSWKECKDVKEMLNAAKIEEGKNYIIKVIEYLSSDESRMDLYEDLIDNERYEDSRNLYHGSKKGCLSAKIKLFDHISNSRISDSKISAFCDIINESEKWEIFDHLAKKQEHAFNILVENKVGDNNLFSKDEIIRKYKNVDLMSLPKYFARYLYSLAPKNENWQTNDNWKKYSNPDKIMNNLKYDIFSDKFSVIKHFSKDEKDIDIFRALLNSGYYKREELASVRFNSIGEKQKEELMNFANEGWQTMDSPSDILKYHVRLVDENYELYNKLKYFYNKDRELYKQLQKKNIYNSSRYVVEEMLKDENLNRQILVDYLLRHPNIYDEGQLSKYKYLKELKEDMEKTIIGQWKEMTNPEEILQHHAKSMDKDYELYLKLKLFYEYNKDIYKQLQKKNANISYGVTNIMLEDKNLNKEILFDYLLQHRSRVNEEQLKKHNLYEEFMKAFDKNKRENLGIDYLMKNATEETKWEIFEKVAKNDENKFIGLMKVYSRTNESDKVIFTKDEIIKRYKDASLEEFPPYFKEYISTLIKQVEDKIKEKEKKETSTWYDNDGELLTLFKLGNITLHSIDDYKKVLDKYLSEDLTIVKFCTKYKISDQKGFSKMLKNFSLDSEEYAQKISSKSEISQAKYLSVAKKAINDICKDGKSVEELLKLSNTYDMESLLQLTRRLYPKTNYDTILALKIMVYYHKRISSYNRKSIEPENIKNMLKEDEVKFIVGKEKYYSALLGSNLNSQSKISDLFKLITSKKTNLSFEKLNAARRNLNDTFSYVDTKFDKKKILNSDFKVQRPDGELVKITPEIVDRAYQFAKENNLYVCDATMGLILRSIANGKIENKDKTIDEKQKMIQEAIDLINKVTSIDEYFKTVDEVQKKLK